MFILSSQNKVLVDNKDGTVSLITKDYFGKILGSVIYKKCVQGRYVWGAASEIYTSCANDTTAGLSWYPAISPEDAIKPATLNIFADIPKDADYWTSFSDTLEKASYIRLNADGRLGIRTVFKPIVLYCSIGGQHDYV